MAFVLTKTNPTPLGLRRGHKFPDGVEDHLEPGVVFLFQGFQFARQVRMGSQNPAHTDKGSHDLDVYRNRPGGVENAGEHGHPLLREGVRRVAPPTPRVPDF